MKRKTWLVWAASILAVAAAVTAIALVKNYRGEEKNSRKYKVKRSELSEVQKRMHFSIHRYEKALFELNRDSLATGIERLSHIYPSQLIAENVWQNPQMLARLRAYLDDGVITEIYQATVQKYPDLNFLHDELTEAFGYYLHYFPEAWLPAVFTMVPGLDFEMPSVFGFDSSLFIQLDHYLGADFKMYAQSGMPKYVMARCDRKYMAIDCFEKSLVYSYLPEETRVSLLENMLHEGKKLYFTELMFPSRLPADIIGYSEAQWAWAEANQSEVWRYIIEKDLLFSKDDKVARNFCEDAPFTKPFNSDAPGRMGAFIGWQIIRKYMENHPEIGLAEMMRSVQYQEMLTKSKYKPALR
ncbi:MAG: hypothetical protein LBK03_02660 [Bacteroidales bacterium]|nr:hypothetical protein [Bacteroidales bacterium]